MCPCRRGLLLGLRLAEERDLPRLGRVGERLERVARLRQRRRDRGLRPASTGRPASAGRPRSSMIARTLPTTVPAMNVSPTLSVPSCTRIVATGPRPLSSLASSTVPDALRLGLALSSLHLGDEQDHLEQRIEVLLLLGRDFDHDGRRRPTLRAPGRGRRARCLTRSALASGLSILLMATMIGTPAALAWSIASRVCGMTPSSAATTRMTMSVTLAPRARMIVNAS